jgi:hypothetical protein
MEANEQVLAYLNQNLNKKIADGNPAPIGKWLDGTLVKAEASFQEDKNNVSVLLVQC